jgi:hypothetical protein
VTLLSVNERICRFVFCVTGVRIPEHFCNVLLFAETKGCTMGWFSTIYVDQYSFEGKHFHQTRKFFGRM